MTDNNFQNASDYIMPFGKYKGSSIGDIASSSDGLKYLDWACDTFDAEKYPLLCRHLEIFMDDPSISDELDEILFYGNDNE